MSQDRPISKIAQDSRGNTLFVQQNEVGGSTYYCNAIGGGVIVWDTAMVSREQLLLALAHDAAHSNQGK